MSEIDNGIKQPLRFYDAVSKQNWRKHWVGNGLKFRVNTDDTGVTIPVICPENAIIPFQIRRRRSPNAITTFNLYTWDDAADDFVFNLDLFTIIPAPSTNHLSIVQLETADNIVWNPIADFTSDLDCGAHYVHLSDGSNNWYSEVFVVRADFRATNKTFVEIFSDATAVSGDRLIRSTGNYLIKDNKPF